MLQCFADDSGSDRTGPVFILAGYVSTVERWMQFSTEWQAVLDDPLQNGSRRLEYFKMVEANSRRDQFWGWSPEERDSALIKLGQIVRKHAMFGVRAIIWLQDFEYIQNQYPNHKIDQYALLFHHLMIAAITKVMDLKIADKIEFIFDDQGVAGDSAVKMFRISKPNLPPEFMTHVSGVPIHKSDREFLPLQCADMIAWQSGKYCRDSHDRRRDLTEPEIQPVMKLLATIDTRERTMYGKEIYKFFDMLKINYPDGLDE